MMDRILSIDPDLKILAGMYFKNKKANTVLNINFNNIDWVCKFLVDFCAVYDLDKIYIEDQKIYKMETAKDIHRLINHTTLIQGFFWGVTGNKDFVEKVSVQEWKGNTPKKIMRDRILSVLTTEEKTVQIRTKTKSGIIKTENINKDCMDALGLGLHKLGRL